MSTRHTKTNKTGVYYEALANGDKSYFITYKDQEGKKVWLKIGLYSAGIRENYCKIKRDEIIHKIRNNEDLPISHKQKAKTITFQEVFDLYIESVKTTKKSWKNDETYYRIYLTYLAEKELEKLTSTDFELLRDNLVKSKKLKAKSINDILGTARQIINYAIRKELVQKDYKNPVSAIKKLKLDNAKIGFFTREQIAILLDIFAKQNYTNYYFTIMLLHTGARFSEVASLTWSEINFNQKTIFFKATKDGNARHIAMSEEVEKLLRAQKKENTLVFFNQETKKQFTQLKRWQMTVDKVVECNATAGRARLTVHSLRHTHASWLALEGMDILQIKEQLGHKKIETTMRYSHLIPSKRHELVRKVF